MNSNKVVSSLLFKFAERMATKVIGFIIGVLLARLLDPGVFGVVAIITAITVFLRTFVDSGLTTALIQNKTADKTDYSTVFYISFGIAVVCYLLLFFCAPIIADFYEISSYVTHFRVLALILLFHAVASIPMVQLTREMEFQKMLVCQLLATVFSGAIGVGMALVDCGVWALIAYYIFDSALVCFFCVLATKWHPNLAFSRVRAKTLFGFAYKILLADIFYSLSVNIRTFIIGKQYSAAELGLYSRGEQIPTIIATTVDNTFRSVLLPFYSMRQDDTKALKNALSKTISLNSYLNFPAMIGLAATASAMVSVIYTSKWSECVPFLQLMVIANLPISIVSPCLTAIKAMGKSDIHLKIESVRRTVMLVMLIISLCFHSMYAIAACWVISCYIDVFVVMIPTRKLIGYAASDLFRDVWPTLLVSLIMGMCVWTVGMLDFPELLRLITQIACGVVVYVALSVILELKVFSEMKDQVLTLIAKK